MKQTLFNLLKIAEIDNKIDEIKETQIKIPGEVKELKAEVQARQSEITAKTDALLLLQNKQKEITQFLHEKNEWIKSREERVSDIKTNKEYQASLKEISTAKKEIKDKDAELATLHPQIDQLTDELNRYKEANEAKIEGSKNTINEQMVKFESAKSLIESALKTREAIAKDFANKQALKYYDRIHSRLSPAMALVNANGVCTECGTQILPQIFNLLAEANDIQTCNRCKRILYLEESLHQE